MRAASLAILEKIGVETGGSNVQFAVNPENGRMIVIEMNPRVSRRRDRSDALSRRGVMLPTLPRSMHSRPTGIRSL